MEERIPEPRRNKNASILASLEEYEVDVSRGIEPRSEGKMSLGGGESTAGYSVTVPTNPRSAAHLFNRPHMGS